MVNVEFREWLARNQAHFDGDGWLPHEIAEMALFVGFDMSLVCHHTVDWRARLARQMKLWDSPLYEHWIDIRDYQKHGRTWDE